MRPLNSFEQSQHFLDSFETRRVIVRDLKRRLSRYEHLARASGRRAPSNVEEHHGLTADPARLGCIYEGCEGDTSCGIYVDILRLFEKVHRPDHFTIVGHEHLPLALDESIVNASCHRIAGPHIRQNFGYNLSLLRFSRIPLQRYQLSVVCLPRVVHRSKWQVLAQHQPRKILTKPSVAEQPFGRLMHCDCACTASYGLEIVLGEFANGL